MTVGDSGVERIPIHPPLQIEETSDLAFQKLRKTYPKAVIELVEGPGLEPGF